MVVHMGVKLAEGKDAKPASDGKMSSSVKNPALVNNPKKEKEWHQPLSAGHVTSDSSICHIVTVKLLDSSHNLKIQAELNSHSDTSVVGSNILGLHYHEHYVDVHGYNSKSRYKNITTVDAVVAYDNLQTGNTSVLLVNQAIQIPSINIFFTLCNAILMACLLMTCLNYCCSTHREWWFGHHHISHRWFVHIDSPPAPGSH